MSSLPKIPDYTCPIIDKIIELSEECTNNVINVISSELENENETLVTKCEDELVYYSSKIKNEAEEVRSANIALRDAITYYKDKANELEDQISNYQEKIDDLDDEIYDLNRTMNELQKDIEELITQKQNSDF